jgi:cell pole-organizing protein PopZ
MEEILASIRRIIADDSNAAGQQSAAPKPGAELEQTDVDALLAAPDSPPPADVLELTQPVEPASANFKAVRGPDVMFREETRPASPPPPIPAPVAAPTPTHAPTPAPRRSPAMKEQDLLSPSSSAAISTAFNSLATTVLTENARTLEDIVKDMLRPLLKQWLEDNLPGLVERLVRAEIERVSRGGR